MDGEITDLQTEIIELLAEALRVEERHAADMGRRDELHVADIDRRDTLHVAELGRRDQASLAGTAALNAQHYDEMQRRDELHAHQLDLLRVALETRDLIGQAKGVLVASLRCSPDEAFELIRKQSNHENRKVIDIAADIMRRATRPHHHG